MKPLQIELVTSRTDGRTLANYAISTSFSYTSHRAVKVMSFHSSDLCSIMGDLPVICFRPLPTMLLEKDQCLTFYTAFVCRDIEKTLSMERILVSTENRLNYSWTALLSNDFCNNSIILRFTDNFIDTLRAKKELQRQQSFELELKHVSIWSRRDPKKRYLRDLKSSSQRSDSFWDAHVQMHPLRSDECLHRDGQVRN